MNVLQFCARTEFYKPRSNMKNVIYHMRLMNFLPHTWIQELLLLSFLPSLEMMLSTHQPQSFSPFSTFSISFEFRAMMIHDVMCFINLLRCVLFSFPLNWFVLFSVFFFLFSCRVNDICLCQRHLFRPFLFSREPTMKTIYLLQAK